MKSFSSTSFASDHTQAMELALAAVNKHPQALFTDFQWFLYEAKDTVFFTAFSQSTFTKDTIGNLVAEMVVLAPTGLAAVNVGGQTIHSFFGFPPRLIRPDDIRRSRNGGLMRRLKVIIIDEVSMVRSDLMWAIDQSLRMNRGRPREAFGGVRLLLFGDLHQLPPVVQGGEVAEHLESAHGGPFFFQIPALTEGAGMSLIELDHVFRQSDERLIEVLNRIRDGEVMEDDLAVLNARTSPIRAR